MIDYFALALGHGLLVYALVYLFFREETDRDPTIEGIEAAREQKRESTSAAGRSAKRRADEKAATETNNDDGALS